MPFNNKNSNGDTNGLESNSEHSNNNRNGTNIVSMEMESLHPQGQSVRQSRQSSQHQQQQSSMMMHPLTSLWMLVKMHLEYYPKISSLLGITLLGLFMYLAVEASKPPLSRHKLAHDYTNIDAAYNWKAAQIDHWCLFGGDDACRCEDFTEPVPRDEIKGWVTVHETNKRSMKLNYDYDVIFLGDDMVELFNGKLFNNNMGGGQRAIEDGPLIKQYFNKTFTKDGGDEYVDGLALGIGGDSSSNLLWRIKHGEMPRDLRSKVWWLWIGTNDLARGGCSEEATVLGILRTAEEIAYHNRDCVVVIMAILPRSSRSDGSLEPHRPSRVDHFFKKDSEEAEVDRARREFLLWPSIQAVNEQLKVFCEKTEHMVYFDASNYFLGSVGNEYFKGHRQEIMTDLMPDYVHPSINGYKVLGQAIHDEIVRIIYDEDEDNDIEEKTTGGN